MLRIDRLSPQEVERARSIRLRSLNEAPDSFGSTYQAEAAYAESDWRKRLERPDAATFVASQHGGGVGIVVGVADPSHAGVAVLNAMWVPPESRGRRVGEALVNAVIDWARSEGCHAVLLGVADQSAAAQRLYERMGLVPTGTVGTLAPPREHLTLHERRLELPEAE
ncbi:MAG: GNAT family N-acetyltransferase [Acidimicrobiales bacterium]